MYFAASHGNVPAVRALLKSPDLDIDEEVLEGEIEPFTALQTAAAWQSPGVVKLLIDAGADVDKCNVDTGTPPLHLAAENGNTTIAMLLIKAGAEVNLAEPLHGKTPLWFAVAEHHMPIVSMLVLSGADVDIAPFDDDDMSPMEMSEDMKCEGITELLRLAPSRTDATVQSSVD
jgi:ankyrin repeat protein